MKDSFDLRPYLRAIGRRWYWIAAAVLIGITIAAVSALSRKPIFSATAQVFYRPTQTQVMLEERVVTTEMIDAAARRRSLVALAKSSNVEAQIPSETLERLSPDRYMVGSLADRITVRVDGDIFQITAHGSTPEQAHDLANAWATGFVDTVNKLYGNKAAGGVSTQVDDLQRRLAEAQVAYENFLGTNGIDELDQRISAVKGVLDASLRADELQYTSYLTRTQELDLVLRDAEALRREVADGRPVGLGENLSALLLRARAIGGLRNTGDGAPALQLQLDPSDALAGEGVTLDDLDALIETLREQIADARSAATALGAAIAEESRGPDSALQTEEQNAYYAQLAELTRQREVEEGKLKALKQERELALEAVQIVRRKQTEQQLAAAQPDAEVSVAWNAVLPVAPSGPSILRDAAIGGAAGMLIGVIAALLAELGGARIPQVRRGRPVERRADSPSSS